MVKLAPFKYSHFKSSNVLFPNQIRLDKNTVPGDRKQLADFSSFFGPNSKDFISVHGAGQLSGTDRKEWREDKLDILSDFLSQDLEVSDKFNPNDFSFNVLSSDTVLGKIKAKNGSKEMLAVIPEDRFTRNLTLFDEQTHTTYELSFRHPAIPLITNNLNRAIEVFNEGDKSPVISTLLENINKSKNKEIIEVPYDQATQDSALIFNQIVSKKHQAKVLERMFNRILNVLDKVPKGEHEDLSKVLLSGIEKFPFNINELAKTGSKQNKIFNKLAEITKNTGANIILVNLLAKNKGELKDSLLDNFSKLLKVDQSASLEVREDKFIELMKALDFNKLNLSIIESLTELEKYFFDSSENKSHTDKYKIIKGELFQNSRSQILNQLQTIDAQTSLKYLNKIKLLSPNSASEIYHDLLTSNIFRVENENVNNGVNNNSTVEFFKLLQSYCTFENHEASPFKDQEVRSKFLINLNTQLKQNPDSLTVHDIDVAFQCLDKIFSDFDFSEDEKRSYENSLQDFIFKKNITQQDIFFIDRESNFNSNFFRNKSGLPLLIKAIDNGDLWRGTNSIYKKGFVTDMLYRLDSFKDEDSLKVFIEKAKKAIKHDTSKAYLDSLLLAKQLLKNSVTNHDVKSLATNAKDKLQLNSILEMLSLLSQKFSPEDIQELDNIMFEKLLEDETKPLAKIEDLEIKSNYTNPNRYINQEIHTLAVAKEIGLNKTSMISNLRLWNELNLKNEITSFNGNHRRLIEFLVDNFEEDKGSSDFKEILAQINNSGVINDSLVSALLRSQLAESSSDAHQILNATALDKFTNMSLLTVEVNKQEESRFALDLDLDRLTEILKNSDPSENDILFFSSILFNENFNSSFQDCYQSESREFSFGKKLDEKIESLPKELKAIVNLQKEFTKIKHAGDADSFINESIKDFKQYANEIYKNNEIPKSVKNILKELIKRDVHQILDTFSSNIQETIDSKLNDENKLMKLNQKFSFLIKNLEILKGASEVPRMEIALDLDDLKGLKLGLEDLIKVIDFQIDYDHRLNDLTPERYSQSEADLGKFVNRHSQNEIFSKMINDFSNSNFI
ncbi:MAG: hypothetical protein HRT47_07590 [Candidatus Caenarcaniphilales bacterium]|nr:hypothetical protein [Candidatus Caenarcaniphilales bacterium]